MPALTAAVLLAVAGCATTEGAPSARSAMPMNAPVLTAGLGAADGHYALGRYHDGMRAWDKAAASYRLAVAAAPAQARGHNALGVSLARLGRYEDAEVALRRAAVLEPDSAMAHSNLGWVVLLAGRPRDALVPLREAVRLDPADSIARANLNEAATQWAQVQAGEAQAQVTDARSQAESSKVRATPSTASTTDAPAAGQIAVPVAAPARIAVAAPITTVAVPEPLGRMIEQPTRPALPVVTPRALAQVVDTPTVEAWSQARVQARFPTSASDAQPVVSLRVAEPVAVAMPVVSTPAVAARVDSVAVPVRVEVSNGNGVRGMAAQLGRWLSDRGVAAQRLTNQKPFTQARTVVQHQPGHEEAARRVAAALPVAAEIEVASSGLTRADVRVVLGHDWQTASGCAPVASCTTVMAMLSTVRAGR